MQLAGGMICRPRASGRYNIFPRARGRWIFVYRGGPTCEARWIWISVGLRAARPVRARRDILPEIETIIIAVELLLIAVEQVRSFKRKLRLNREHNICWTKIYMIVGWCWLHTCTCIRLTLVIQHRSKINGLLLILDSKSVKCHTVAVIVHRCTMKVGSCNPQYALSIIKTEVYRPRLESFQCSMELTAANGILILNNFLAES